MRRVFKEEGLQKAYETNGYVVVPFFNPQQVTSLLEKYRTLPAVDKTGTYAFLNIADQQLKKAANTILLDYGRQIGERYLHHYRPLFSNFVIKTPQSEGTWPFHQDWSYVDERNFASINCWCPLVDVGEENGVLCVLRGSHRLGYNLRGPYLPNALQDIIEHLDYGDMTFLPMKAGELVFFDNRLIHGSPPNRSKSARVAFAIVSIPEEAQAIHYFQNPDSGNLEQYACDTAFFEEYHINDARKIPESAKFLRVINDYQPVKYSLQQITPFLGNGRKETGLFSQWIRRLSNLLSGDI